MAEAFVGQDAAGRVFEYDGEFFDLLGRRREVSGAYQRLALVSGRACWSFQACLWSAQGWSEPTLVQAA